MRRPPDKPLPAADTSTIAVSASLVTVVYLLSLFALHFVYAVALLPNRLAESAGPAASKLEAGSDAVHLPDPILPQVDNDLAPSLRLPAPWALHHAAAQSPICRLCALLLGSLLLTCVVGVYAAQYRWIRKQFSEKLQDWRLFYGLLGTQGLGVGAALVLVGLPWLLQGGAPWHAQAWFTGYALLHGAQQAALLFLFHLRGGGLLYPKLTCVATSLALQLVSVCGVAVGVTLPTVEWLAVVHGTLGHVCWATQEFGRGRFTAFTVDLLLPISQEAQPPGLGLDDAGDPLAQFLGAFAHPQHNLPGDTLACRTRPGPD